MAQGGHVRAGVLGTIASGFGAGDVVATDDLIADDEVRALKAFIVPAPGPNNFNAVIGRNNSEPFPAIFGENPNSLGYAIYSNGDLGVAGDAIFFGAKIGYVTDLVLNVSDQEILAGDLVEIVGSKSPPFGGIPIITIRRTTTASSHRVLGPVVCAMNVIVDGEIESVQNGYVPGQQDQDQDQESGRRSPFRISRIEGPILPQKYGMVVTLGAYFEINVDAGYGSVYPGDLLVSSPNPGYAMVADDPRVGTVVGKALETLERGEGKIRVFVSPR